MRERRRRLRTMTTTPEERLAVSNGRFAELAAENSPALLAYISRRVINLESAPEILNDALLISWRKRDRLPSDPEQARMWLFTVARNCLRNHERFWNRRRANESPLSEILEAVRPATDNENGEITELVRRLPDKYREIVMLIHWDGFSIVEAAHLLKLDASTARIRYSRARERIRAEIEAL